MKTLTTLFRHMMAKRLALVGVLPALGLFGYSQAHAADLTLPEELIGATEGFLEFMVEDYLERSEITARHEIQVNPLDPRLRLAACDSDLKRLTERGLFDKDLYEIVSKSVIRVPALRSRREDMPKLVDHIILELAAQHQMAKKTVLPETLQLLKEYDWPGNIKQLQSVIEYAFFNTKGDVIRPENINLMGDIKPDNKWKEDREVFVKAWQAAGGNVSRLANLLNVSRVTLYRYLKKYGLEKS